MVMNGAGRILIVEDDVDTRWLLAQGCVAANYAVVEAASGQEALEKIRAEPFDVVLLDLGLPDVDGIDILDEIASSDSELITIILTANPTQQSAIAAIRTGVSDYLRKPVMIKQVLEVMASKLERRAHRQRRLIELGMLVNETVGDKDRERLRNGGEDDDTSVIRHVGVELDRRTHVVTIRSRGSSKFVLTDGETAILAAMLQKVGKALSYQDLAYEAWGERLDRDHATSIIRPIIFRLRQKLEQNPSVPRLIRTVRGVGYMFHPG